MGECIDEFKKWAFMGDIEEIEDKNVSRFLRGLNFNIFNIVELYPYADIDTLCCLCSKVEAQSKPKHGNSCVESSKVKSWPKTESFPKKPSSSSFIGAASASVVEKPMNTHKETNLSKVRCFKCQGFGHYQNACPKKRVVTLREACEYRDELFEEEQMNIIFNEE